jgi:hypothetical protein
VTKLATVHLWPVPGRFLMGVPTVECDVDPLTAAHYVKTGAFTDEPPPEADAQPEPAGAGPDKEA